MSGILMTSTSVIGNVDGQQLHFAVSTATLAATDDIDATRLAANGGSYRTGDIVIASCTDGILVGKVAANGSIVPMA